MKNILLVILYNKQIVESSTLLSLSKSDYKGDVVIFNNGPLPVSNTCATLLAMKQDNRIVRIEEDLNNRPLSIIYNDFLELIGYDNYFIFDDDTVIPNDFFSAKIRNNCQLSLPLILSEKTNIIHYPKINGEPCNIDVLLVKDIDDVISIGSGLMIHRFLIDIFKKNHQKLFDEKFALYGVDYSLFRRISKLKSNDVKIKIDISGVLKHSLSSEENNVSSFRTRERLIDLILNKIYYSEHGRLYNFLSIGKTIIEQILSMNIYNVFVIIRVLCHGQHPRIRQFKK
ncbi:hypothetical protein ACKT82_06250 [Escherichia coli]|uniref:hypothetical protein n=1 Tax=Escherichia coli TaxID=562 RepID=UPI003AB0B22F